MRAPSLGSTAMSVAGAALAWVRAARVQWQFTDRSWPSVDWRGTPSASMVWAWAHASHDDAVLVSSPVAPGRASRSDCRTFYVAVLLLEAGMLGVYMALDLLLFWLSWVLAAASMCVLIALAGRERRGRQPTGGRQTFVRMAVIAIGPGLVIFAGMLALHVEGPRAHRRRDVRPADVPASHAAVRACSDGCSSRSPSGLARARSACSAGG